MGLKTLVKIKLILLFLLLSLLFVIFSLRQEILRYAVNKSIAAFKNDSILLDVQTPRFVGSSIKINNLKITFKKNLLFFPILLEHVKIDPHYMALFSKNLDAHINSHAYTGKMDLNIKHHIASNKFTLNGNLNKIQFYKHEQISALGIASGYLTGNFESLVIENNLLKSINSHIIMKNVKFPENRILSPQMTGQPFPIEIPKFTIKSLNFDADLNKGLGHIHKLKLNSNLVKITGFMDFRASPNLEIEINKAKFRLELTKIGQKKYGPLIAALSQPKINTNTYEITASDGFRKFAIRSILQP